MNFQQVRQESDQYWMLEASKELDVSVHELKRRNLPENKLYVAISSDEITDEISNANVHKFLREHPGWEGFGPPSIHHEAQIEEQRWDENEDESDLQLSYPSGRDSVSYKYIYFDYYIVFIV